jgi:hypothetical protein
VSDQCQLTASVKEASKTSNEISNPKVTDYFTLNKVQQLESWHKQKVISCEINTYVIYFLQKSPENGRNSLEGGKNKAAQPQNKKFKTFAEIDGDEVERFVI